MNFQIDPQEDFLDLNVSFFDVEHTIKKFASNLLATDVLGLANNLANTLFKQINVRLNGTLISPQMDTYHYKAMIETALNYDRDGESILAPKRWFNCLNVPDNAADEYTADMLNPAHNDYKAMSEDQKNLVQSRLQFIGGKKVALRFKPFLEVFHLSKHLVPGVQIQIEMYFNPPAVWTMRWHGASTLRLTEANVDIRFFLNQVRVTPLIYREIEIERKGKLGLPGEVVVYPTVRGEIHMYSHPNNNRHFERSNPFHNQLPNRLVVCLMEQAAFNGDVTKYRFSFKKFNLSSIKQLVRGEEYPYETLELKHDGDSKDERGYNRFLRAAGSLLREREHGPKRGLGT